MVKGKRNILRAWLICMLLIMGQHSGAQVEVISPEEDEVIAEYYDNISDSERFDVQERQIPDSLLNALKNDDAFWYANATPVKKKIEEERRKTNADWLHQNWVRVLLWFIILGSFVAVLAWYLSTLNIRMFRKPPAAISQLPDASLADDIFAIDFETNIQYAIARADYRMAVRLYYLHTLRLLSDKNMIRYKQDLTNSEYVAQLYSTNYYRDFFRLTRNFEYTWYGGFPVHAAAFEGMQKDFQTFQNRLPS